MKRLKFLKTYENHAHSIKQTIITKSQLTELLGKINLVTLPFFNDEPSLLHHIDKNFDNSDGALIMSPAEELTSIEQNGDIAVLYTKYKTYLIEDMSHLEFQEFENEIN